jgi:hypothetical protein
MNRFCVVALEFKRLVLRSSISETRLPARWV